MLHGGICAVSIVRGGRLRAGGGGASPEALQIRADIFGMPVIRTREPQAGTVGMAMLCGLATKEFSSFGEAAAALVHDGEVFQPRAAYRQAYAQKFAQYKRMYNAARHIYGRD